MICASDQERALLELLRPPPPTPQQRVAAAKIVRGPDGVPLCLNDLPTAGVRWTPKRKAVVVAAVIGGLISRDELFTRYPNLSADELQEWIAGQARRGLDGLKTTRRPRR